MAVAAPRDAYMFNMQESGRESPPPFTQGNWNDPLFEKMNSTAQAQRDYDAGMYSRAI